MTDDGTTELQHDPDGQNQEDRWARWRVALEAERCTMREMIEEAVQTVTGESDPGGKAAHDAHYAYTYQGVRIDPYRILYLYQITHPAHQHAVKKLLRAGRSVKDLRRDIEEVQMALSRWVEMLDEGEADAARTS